MNTTGKTNWLPIAIIGIVVLIIGGYIQIPTGSTGGTGGFGQPTAPVTTLTGNPQFILPIADAINGTGLNGTIIVLQDGTQISSNTGTTATAANPTNLTSNATYTLELSGVTDYFYPTTATLTAPAAGSKTEVIKVSSIATALPEMTCYQSDNITAASTSARQTIGANDQRTMRCRFRISSGDHNVFSDGVVAPLVVCEYDPDHFTSIVMQEGSSAMSATGVPSGHSIVDMNRSATVAGLMNTKALKFGTDYDVYFTLKSGSVNPYNAADGDADENGAVWCTVYDGFRQKDNTSGLYVEAYRNVNTPSSAVGATDWKFPLFYQ